ncbi:E3 ubiquitin-protein ligase MIB2-like [Phymastichus coffea]|uniref:E3 ubiquitin-protein ligase MIB2-like n=1 Tax=Phymastichus coffea TaxID=108790 RepID=UPI00273B3AA4|nr:E3 ubiquitin-protein ligase MIB2-like [Phymastichus coffea]
MLFSSDCTLVYLINSQDNDEVKSIITTTSVHNAVDEKNNTLLHYAAEYGNPEIVQFLIDLGSNVDPKNNLGQTPIVKSFQSDLPCKNVISILLRAGSDIMEQDVNGYSAFSFVNCIEWLMKDTRRVEILKVVLEYQNLIYYLSCFNVLIEANKEVIKTLVQTNIDLCVPDIDRQSLVHVLAMNPHPHVTEQLHGKNFDVDMRDNFGRTPLMYAAMNGNVGGVKFLLNEGADIEAIDYDNMTALYIAIISKMKNAEEKLGAIQVLLGHGANLQIKIAGDSSRTIFDALLKDKKNFVLAKLMLAHLALQELVGTSILELIRNKIDSNIRFKSYFEYCHRQLSMTIYPSITLFDLLTLSSKKMEHYLRNKEFKALLNNYETTIDYFNNILYKRVEKASRMVELKKAAAKNCSTLMKFEYDNYPFIADQIVDYLEERDIECLKLITSK